MKSAIEELILLNSNFMDNIQYNEKSREIIDDFNKLYEKLKATLNEEQIKLLDNLINLRIDFEAEDCDCNLIHGFKTAVRLMTECL